MYGKRVNAVIWNDVRNPARGEIKRTRFVASYILDDGFASLEECKAAVPEPSKWAYVRFCGNWYAVNADSYRCVIVVSREYVRISEYAGGSDSVVTKHLPKKAFLEGLKDIAPHDIGPRRWTDGVFQDFLRIDPDLQVTYGDGKIYTDPVQFINTVIVLGNFFFATDICIRTDNYVNHVFKHYYNDRSMERVYAEIKGLRSNGIEYWNPFTKNTATDEADKNRQKKAREKDLDMGEINEDREYLGEQKMMDISDTFADARANGMAYEGRYGHKSKYRKGKYYGVHRKNK